MSSYSEQQLKKARIATRLIFLFSGIGVASWAPMVPFAKSRLDLNEADLGLVLLAFGVGALLTMPLTGWLVHRFGSRIVTFIAGFILICVLPFLTIASSVLLLSLSLFLFGAVEGALNVAMNAHAVLVEKHSQRPLMSGFHCLFSAGGLVGAVILSVLLEANYTLFACGIAVTAILAIILFTQCQNLLSSIEKSHGVESSTKFVLPQGRVLLLGALCFILFLTEGSMLDWSAVFLRSSLDYDAATAGIGFAVFSIAMAIGRFFGDRLIGYFGPILTVQMGSLICAAGLLLAVNFHWAHAELLGFALIGLGASNIVPVLFSAAGSLPGTSASYGLTVVTTFGYAGLLLGPAVIGFVAQATTLSIALTSVAVLLVAVGFSARSTQPEEPVAILD
jgi:fucose permease